MLLQPDSRNWLLRRNLLATGQVGSAELSDLGLRYLQVFLAEKPKQLPADLKNWMVHQTLVMPAIPGVQ